MVPVRNRLLPRILGLFVWVFLIYLLFRNLWFNHKGLGFVKRKGTQFVVDDKPLYVNGWNSYWLMDHAVDERRRNFVGDMLETGAKMGLTVCRTWAFHDGGDNALQISPGKFDERVFKALDYVIAEAKKHDVRLLLSLVNNLQAYGGKTQYVKWAWQEGVGVSTSNDSFFFDPSIRNYFKNYLKVLLTRNNSVTGIEYRYDPTIFAWELINEPRCETDPSGKTLQDWIDEMTGYIKTIDKQHLLTVGLEGFYGPKNLKRLTVNPEDWASELGSDFVQNSKSSNIDFASVHIYPDQWLHNRTFEEMLKFAVKWMQSHIEDGLKELEKPVLFTEFGLSNLNKDYKSSQRDEFYRTIFDVVYKSANQKKAGAGALMWQLFMEGMETNNDEFGIVPNKQDSIYKLMIEQSCRLGKVTERLKEGRMKHLCSHRH